MRYKYYFCDLNRTELVNWLDKNLINYNSAGGGVVPQLVYFSIFSSAPNCKELLIELGNLNVKKPVITVEYTSSELSSANWLVIRPKKQCIDIINSRDAYVYSCRWTTSSGVRKAKHEAQQGLFAIAREPSAKTSTAFWAPDTGFAEIFTDQRIVDLSKEHNLVGFDFKNVLLKNGNISQYLYQMTSPYVLNKDCIALGYGEEKLACPMCGKEQYYINDTYQLHLNMHRDFTQSDLFVTERIFGEGRAYPLYIISQRFYQLIKKHKLTGNLMISPVVDIVL